MTPTGTVRATIRVNPGVRRAGVGGDHDGALVVRVTARAVDGKATDAALRAVAEAVGVRPRDVELVTGATSRIKTIDITTDDPTEARRIRTRLDHLRTGPDRST